jgi:hypothetical protein
MKNRRYLLKSRPQGSVSRSNFSFVEENMPAVGLGEVLVRNQFISLDPTHRIWMADIPQYMPPIALGEVIRSIGLGVVEESKAEGFAKGDLVRGMVGWQDYSLHAAKALEKLPAAWDVPGSSLLSVLGLTGTTAYIGLLDFASPKAGETVVISGAAGAVGSVAGQIAKIKGMKAFGIAGSEEKCRWLTDELGFDGAVNYRDPEWRDKLGALCPQGIDVYFDNVGGEVSDAVWSRMNLNGRVVICGLISGYNQDTRDAGPKNYPLILTKRLTVRGFIVSDDPARVATATKDLYQWVREGRIQYKEDIVSGLENAPEALNKLFDGSNSGKLLLRI